MIMYIVTKDFGNFGETGSIHGQVGGSTVTTIMEAKMRNLSAFHSPLKASRIPTGLVPVLSGNTKGVSRRRTLTCCVRTSKAYPVSGTALRSPFLV
jgi:hypothetical protein